MSIIAGIAVLVWFYLAAKQAGQGPVRWVVVGMVGYWLACWGVKLAVVSFFSGSDAGKLLALQLPALFGLAAAFLVKKKLLAELKTPH